MSNCFGFDSDPFVVVKPSLEDRDMHGYLKGGSSCEETVTTRSTTDSYSSNMSREGRSAKHDDRSSMESSFADFGFDEPAFPEPSFDPNPQTHKARTRRRASIATSSAVNVDLQNSLPSNNHRSRKLPSRKSSCRSVDAGLADVKRAPRPKSGGHSVDGSTPHDRPKRRGRRASMFGATPDDMGRTSHSSPEEAGFSDPQSSGFGEFTSTNADFANFESANDYGYGEAEPSGFASFDSQSGFDSHAHSQRGFADFDTKQEDYGYGENSNPAPVQKPRRAQRRSSVGLVEDFRSGEFDMSRQNSGLATASQRQQNIMLPMATTESKSRSRRRASMLGAVGNIGTAVGSIGTAVGNLAKSKEEKKADKRLASKSSSSDSLGGRRRQGTLLERVEVGGGADSGHGQSEMSYSDRIMMGR